MSYRVLPVLNIDSHNTTILNISVIPAGDYDMQSVLICAICQLGPILIIRVELKIDWKNSSVLCGITMTVNRLIMFGLSDY